MEPGWFPVFINYITYILPFYRCTLQWNVDLYTSIHPKFPPGPCLAGFASWNWTWPDDSSRCYERILFDTMNDRCEMYVSLCTSRIGMSSGGSKSFEVKKTLLDLCSLLRCGSGQPGLWGLPAERLRPAIAACAASVASQCGRGWSVTQWMHCCHDVPSVWRWPRVYLKGPPLLITEASTYSLLRLVLGCMGKFGIHQWLLGQSRSVSCQKCCWQHIHHPSHSDDRGLLQASLDCHTSDGLGSVSLSLAHYP